LLEADEFVLPLKTAVWQTARIRERTGKWRKRGVGESPLFVCSKKIDLAVFLSVQRTVKAPAQTQYHKTDVRL
jgi:hypothetical protein